MKFKPQLFSNDLPTYDDITYPVIASYKLDGIRCIFKDGEMLSRSLKQIPNKQLQERFQFLKDYSRVNNIILDGELYDHNMTFQEITHYVMTEDFESERSIKKHGEVKVIPDTLQFHMFDRLNPDNLNEKYIDRLLHNGIIKFKYLRYVKTSKIPNKQLLEAFYKKALNNGYEGLIVRNPESKYKMGRVTFKSGDGYKFKPYRTFDAVIKNVIQATKVRDGAEKTTNELGRSVTSKKKDDRVLVNKAAAFLCEYEGKDIKVVIAMTDKEKEKIWKDRDKYINSVLEYKAMLLGAKDVPRHPVMLRFINPKTK